MKEVKMVMGRREMRFQVEGRQLRLPGLLYAYDLVLCGESEEDLRAMVPSFYKVCRKRGLKVNVGKSKVMLLGGEEGWSDEGCVRKDCRRCSPMVLSMGREWRIAVLLRGYM